MLILSQNYFKKTHTYICIVMNMIEKVDLTRAYYLQGFKRR